MNRQYGVTDQNEQEYRKLVLAAHNFLADAGQFMLDELGRIEDGFSGKISANEMLGMATRALVDAYKEAQGVADGTEDGTWPKK